MLKGLAVVLQRMITDCRNHNMPHDDRKLFQIIWVFTSSTVPWFPCLRNCNGIFPTGLKTCRQMLPSTVRAGGLQSQHSKCTRNFVTQ